MLIGISLIKRQQARFRFGNNTTFGHVHILISTTVDVKIFICEIRMFLFLHNLVWRLLVKITGRSRILFSIVLPVWGQWFVINSFLANHGGYPVNKAGFVRKLLFHTVVKDFFWLAVSSNL